jgi:4-amino-4-deoxy-L-arabinose transferase-like glycosyltransferase
VINHDESTYIVIADEMLRGEVYLDESIDTKPVGLFWLYAAMVALTGGSIIGLRFLATVFIALTAYCLFLAGRRATGISRVGWAAGLSYPLTLSLYTYYGISPNTELFFNFFTAAAVLLTIPRLVARWEDVESLVIKPWHYALAGLSLGAAVIIKPVAGAEALAIGLFLLYWGWRKGRLNAAIFKACLPMTLAFVVPILVVVAYYAQLGMLEEMYFYNWEVSRRYPADKAWYLRLKYMGDYALRYFPLVLLAIAALRERAPDRPWQYFLLLQLAIVATVVVLPGKTFGHYQVQLDPVLCALAACWWLPKRKEQAWLRRISLRKGLIAFLALATLVGIGYFVKYQLKYDRGAAAAAWLETRLEPDEQFYMLLNNQIVYHLMDRPAPSPYVHGTLIYYHHHIVNMEVDLEAEAARIANDPKLRYVLAYTR